MHRPAPVTIALPIADRPRSFAFYQAALGLEAFGPPAGPTQQPWGYVATFAVPDGHLWMLNASQPPPSPASLFPGGLDMGANAPLG